MRAWQWAFAGVGVLNIINMLHGSLIILGVPDLVCLARVSIRWWRWCRSPRCCSCSVGRRRCWWCSGRCDHTDRTFGLDLILQRAEQFRRDTERVTMDLGTLLGDVVIAWDRIVAMALALLLTLAVPDPARLAYRPRDRRGADGRDAAALMGIRIDRIYATTFAIGAALAGAWRAALVFPITTNLSGQLLGKAFVVRDQRLHVPAALVGAWCWDWSDRPAATCWPQNAVLIGFVLMLVA
jgi:branched-chain amino acid transport system permease protein